MYNKLHMMYQRLDKRTSVICPHGHPPAGGPKGPLGPPWGPWSPWAPWGPNPPSMGVSIFKKFTKICIFGVQNGDFWVQNGALGPLGPKSKLGFDQGALPSAKTSPEIRLLGLTQCPCVNFLKMDTPIEGGFGRIWAPRGPKGPHGPPFWTQKSQF